MYDNKVYGELSDITDCPGDYCVPIDKKGMMVTGCSLSHRGPMCTQGSCYPWHKLFGGGVYKQTVILERNEFHNFHNETNLGMK
jgi:hypothetical protein